MISSKKLRHPAFWLMALVRIGETPLFFVNPWIGWLLEALLDILDSTPWRYIAGLTAIEYEVVDKYVDNIVYLVMLLSAIKSPAFLFLLVLLVFRSMGLVVFSKTRNECLFLLFPNFFEFAWIWAIALPTITLPSALLFLRGVEGLVLLLFLKFLQEILKHSLGPKYIFPYTSKFWETRVK